MTLICASFCISIFFCLLFIVFRHHTVAEIYYSFVICVFSPLKAICSGSIFYFVAHFFACRLTIIVSCMNHFSSLKVISIYHYQLYLIKLLWHTSSTSLSEAIIRNPQYLIRFESSNSPFPLIIHSWSLFNN